MNHVLTFYGSEPTAVYLGPWCSTCGKKGLECRDRAKCVRRSILLHPGPKFVTLGAHRRYGQQRTRMEVQAVAYRECVKRGRFGP